jgi:hypothetical protein
LFNTYQYYIVLSEDYTGCEIYKPYFQFVQALDRSSAFDERDFFEGKLNLPPKDIQIYAMQYGVDYNAENPNEFAHTINEKIRLATNKQDLTKFITGRIGADYILFEISRLSRNRKPIQSAYRFYFEDFVVQNNDDYDYVCDYDSRFREAVYKKFTPADNDGCYLYPERIHTIFNKCKSDIKDYCYKKSHALYEHIENNTDSIHSLNLL